jgi:excisionase family DNA binding protein
MPTMTDSPSPAVSPQWIRMTAWCEQTGMPRSSAYLAIKRGELRAVRVGGRYYVPVEELERMRRAGQVAA